MARFTLTGDLGKLDKLIARLDDSDEALDRYAKDAAEESLNLVKAGFTKGSDPYGAGWGAPNNLQITGRMKSYAKGTANKKGWEIHSTDKKAIWHHAPQKRASGWKLPTRLQVPVKAKGLPTKWSKAFKEMAEDHLEAWFSGG